jgi:multidrug resistance protein MdtO
MATKPTYIPHAPHAARFATFFPDFLRKELAPYPGRAAVVARMVISATITAILIVTWSIPFGAIGALCAFLLSRENPQATIKSGLYLLGAFVIGGLFIPVGARLFASIPITHFLWEGVSIFILFFLLRTLTNFVLALGMCAMVTNIFTIWYLPGPGEQNVETSLWQVGAAGIGCLVTIAVELVFYSIRHGDEVIDGVDARLEQIEDLMNSYAANRPVSPETVNKLAQYAVVGVSALRTHVARTATDPPAHGVRRNALVSITGRSIAFAAALSNMETPDIKPQRAAQLARHIAEIRQCLQTNRQPSSWEPETSGAGTPITSELESTISLIPSVFSSEASIDPLLEVPDAPPSSNRIFVDDAFSNPEHLTFVLGATLAAMTCYVLYVSLDWPGISTSVTTCIFTALSNVGASRQKQVLRLAGAILGGFVFGLGAQIFILPYVDSIVGFSLLFAAVTAVAAWVSTSSTRLSYAGLQIALAFYLIELSEPRFQTSLTIGRDRAIGVLLGISMMWLFFERFYPRPAGDEMVRIFVGNLRLMAELIMTSSDRDTATIIRVRKQRNQIYRQFGNMTAQADAVPFETGPARVADMAARDRLRRWQTSLRTFYLLETPLIQFRLFGDISQQARPFAQMERVFREQCAQSFRDIAECLEKQLNNKPYECSAPRRLVQLLDTLEAQKRDPFTEREQALMRVTRTIASLVDRFHNEVATEPLYVAG